MYFEICKEKKNKTQSNLAGRIGPPRPNSRPNSRPPPPANPSRRYPWFPLPAATFLSPLSHPAVSLSLLPSLSPRTQTRAVIPAPATPASPRRARAACAPAARPRPVHALHLASCPGAADPTLLQPRNSPRRPNRPEQTPRTPSRHRAARN
jgi:hypothetical protein